MHSEVPTFTLVEVNVTGWACAASAPEKQATPAGQSQGDEEAWHACAE